VLACHSSSPNSKPESGFCLGLYSVDGDDAALLPRRGRQCRSGAQSRPKPRTQENSKSLAIHSSPRQVAGGARSENILKCTLKPLNFSDYTGIIFTGTQQSRLQAVFSTGVCDYTKPGIGQQAPVSPRTYVGGPGGVPLPAAPQSTPI
jgi:hypothetical protein